MKSNKNLIIFTGSYPFGKGENFIEQELNYCIKKFEKITIIPIYYGTSKTPRCVPDNVKFFKPVLSDNPILLLIKGLFNSAPVRPFLKELFQAGFFKRERIFRWLRMSFGTRILLRSQIINTIINNSNCQLYFYWGTGAAYMIPFLKKTNCIIKLHGSDLYEESNPLFFRNEIYKRSNYIVTISDFGKKYIIDRYPQFKHKISVFKLGTNNFGIGKSSNDSIIRIISCSSVIALKRVNAIAEALTMITDKQIIWTHIGTGPLLESLEEKTSFFPKNINAILLGYLSNQEIMKFYSSEPIDIFINVSESEGLPVSIMEAYSFGIPAIATNVGGTEEIVNSENGILLDKNFNIKQLVEAIQKMSSENLFEKRKNARMIWENNYNASVNFNIFTHFLYEISNA